MEKRGSQRLYGTPYNAIQNTASARIGEDVGGVDGANYNVIEPPLL